MPRPLITVNVIRDQDGNYNLPGGVNGQVPYGCYSTNGTWRSSLLISVLLDPVTGAEITNYLPGAIVATRVQNECNGSYVIVKETPNQIDYLIMISCALIIRIRPTVLFDIGIGAGVVTMDASKTKVTGAASYRYKVYYTDNLGGNFVLIIDGMISDFNISDLTNWNNNVFSVELEVTDEVGSGKASYDFIPTDSGGLFIGRLTNGCKPILAEGDFNSDFNSDFLI